MKINMHTHTIYCDGKNSPEEMIQDAISAGFDVLGFSGHSYTSYDGNYCMSLENTVLYTAEVRRLAEKYHGQIQIYCGIEKDFFADEPVDSQIYDYGIGSVHTIFKPCNTTLLRNGDKEIPGGILVTEEGCYVYMDWEQRTLQWAIHHLYGGDALALAEDYFHTAAQIAGMDDVQIVGHFDLLTKFEEQLEAAGKPKIFDTEHPRYRQAAVRAIRNLSNAGKIFEINTGAMAKGYRTTPYPSLPLLCEIKKAGGRIMINSDCHAAGTLDYGYEQAMNLAREAGFTYLSYPLAGGNIMEVPL